MYPILFTVAGGGPVFAFGMMLGIALVTAWFLTLRVCVLDGLNRATMRVCFVISAIAAVAGARLLSIAESGAPLDLRMNEGGLSGFGALLGVAVSAAFCKACRVPFQRWADAASPALCTSLVLVRIGCFLRGCEFGRPWDGPWAVHFPEGSPALVYELRQGLIPAGARQSLSVHPTQLYEALGGLLLLAVVAVIRRRRIPGEAAGAFVAGYAAVRLGVEFLRGNRAAVWGPLSRGQLYAMLGLLLGGAFLWLRPKRKEDLHSMAVRQRRRSARKTEPGHFKPRSRIRTLL